MPKSLDTFPDGYQHTGFMDWGYQICTKPRDTYLVFYVLDESKQVVPVLRIMQDGMNWQYIIGRWIRKKLNINEKGCLWGNPFSFKKIS